MAGRHQFILGLIVKKMREEGIRIFGIDGYYPGLFGEKIPLPPKILRHRPDAVGIKEDGQICFGEAKTENDLSNKRTYEQLEDFSTIKLNEKTCEVFIGLPRSAKAEFDGKLEKNGLKNSTSIKILYIPDEIIND